MWMYLCHLIAVLSLKTQILNASTMTFHTALQGAKEPEPDHDRAVSKQLFDPVLEEEVRKTASEAASLRIICEKLLSLRNSLC